MTSTLMVPVISIPVDDPVWNPFHESYPLFHEWLDKCRKTGRRAWITPDLEGICVFKHEHDPVVTDSRCILKGNVLKICSFYVKDMYRRKGIGTLLLDTALRYAGENRLDHCYTHSSNPEIWRFFAKFGFTTRGSYPIEGRAEPDVVVSRRIKQ